MATTITVPLHGKWCRSTDPTYQRDDAVVFHHPKCGLIYPFQGAGDAWWVVGGHTEIQACGRRHAFWLASEWERRGKCPAPKRLQVTPKSA